jgi:hypothetical protein
MYVMNTAGVQTVQVGLSTNVTQILIFNCSLFLSYTFVYIIMYSCEKSELRNSNNQ